MARANERDGVEAEARADVEDGSRLARVLMGAAAGAVGVWALDRIDWFMWNREGNDTRARTRAARPGGEPPAQALVSKVEKATGRELGDAGHEMAAQVVHYAIGIGPAIGYALLRDRLPGRGVARGAAFGAGLFLAQDELFNTVTGLGGRPGDYPWTAHARGLVAHTVYGIATELALSLFEQAGELVSTEQRPTRVEFGSAEGMPALPLAASAM